MKWTEERTDQLFWLQQVDLWIKYTYLTWCEGVMANAVSQLQNSIFACLCVHMPAPATHTFLTVRLDGAPVPHFNLKPNINCLNGKRVVKGNRVKAGGWFLTWGWGDAVHFPHWPDFIEVHCSVKAAQWGLLVTVTLQCRAASCSESPAWPQGAQREHRLCPASTTHGRVLGSSGKASLLHCHPKHFCFQWAEC